MMFLRPGTEAGVKGAACHQGRRRCVVLRGFVQESICFCQPSTRFVSADSNDKEIKGMGILKEKANGN